MQRVKTKYKKTDVGLIPDDWDVASIGSKSTKVGSGITPTGGERIYKDFGRPFVRSQNVGWGQLIIEGLSFIDEQTHRTFDATEIKEGDVFLNITGASIGRSTLADGFVIGGNVNQHVCIIRTIKDELEPRFLNVFLLSSFGQRQVASFQAGGNREGLNFGQIRSFRLTLPPLPEQRAIAAALSDVDALINSLERLIAKKRDIEKTTMQQLLAGITRLPGFSQEWQEKSLTELADIQRGASPRPIESPIWYDRGSNVGWVRISDISASDGKYLQTTKDFLSRQGIANSRFLPSGSLIMSICATVGIPVITQIDTCIHDGFVGFTRLREVDQTFLYYKLKYLEPAFKAIGQTGSQSNLNTNLVRAYKIKLPPVTEQLAISEFLSDMDYEIVALEKQRDKIVLLKQGMMQELLTGRIRLV